MEGGGMGLKKKVLMNVLFCCVKDFLQYSIITIQFLCF